LCLPDVIVAVLFILLFFGLAVSLILLLGEAPNTPTRGGVEWVLNFLVLFLAVVSFLLLLYRATVESFRAVWLARRLMEHDGWPARLRARFMPVGEPRPGLIKPVFDAVDRRLDAELIARVTQPVQRLIFYPFIVLALLMFSRSELLDAWNLPAMLLVLFVIYIALLVLAAWRLRVTAEELRQRADRSLDDLIAATGIRGDEALTKQLRAMREHLRGLRIGAFAPFSQQPLVHAALTVIGSSSGIALLEIARTANI
jgi:hypothetical protein